MTAKSTLNALIRWAMPMKSNRRLAGCTIKQVTQSPPTIAKRVNPNNLGNFLRYPRRHFDCRAHYRGDSLTSGILAYRVFGGSLFGKLEALGFEVGFRRLEAPSNFVMDRTCSLPFDGIKGMMRPPYFAVIATEKSTSVATR